MMWPMAGHPQTLPQPPLPSPTSTLLLHLSPPTQHHRSQPGCGDAGGVTSKGQEVTLCHSGEGGAPGDVPQQLGGGFGAPCHEGLLTRRKTCRCLGHRSTLAFLRVNLSIGFMGPSHILPPPLQLWSLLARQNTAFVAYGATGRAGGGAQNPASPQKKCNVGTQFPPIQGLVAYGHTREYLGMLHRASPPLVLAHFLPVGNPSQLSAGSYSCL